MKLFLWRVGLALILSGTVTRLLADVVIEDDGVSMSREELAYIVTQWSARMQRDAANDLGDRLELLNKAMATKKIAIEAMKMTPEKDGDRYWRKELLLRKAMQKFLVDEFIENIEAPDLSALAEERYLTEKAKYAAVPPRRLSSHILWLCPPSQGCDPRALVPEAQKVLAQLRAGADFEAMVEQYSQDPGTRQKKGLFDQWLEPKQPDVDREYLKAVFAIEKAGEYSEVVVSQYGLHIIRLEEIKPAYYKTYDEVKERIYRDLAQEYTQLAVKIFDEGFRFTDDLYIDGAAVDEIFAPYKAAE